MKKQILYAITIGTVEKCDFLKIVHLLLENNPNFNSPYYNVNFVPK